MEQSPRRLSILALDDDVDDLLILRHHLEGMPGVLVDLAAHQDPEQAIEVAGRKPLDAVILDYQLGPRSGLDFFKSLRKSGVDVPVIMVTDHGSEQVAVDALQGGVSDYLPKSVLSPRSLQRSLLNAIDKDQLQKELARHRGELERAVRDLRARNEEIQNFYHTLSHELKTPLTAAREFVSILLDGLQGPMTEEQLQSLQIARNCCDDMAVLINDILDAARIETGKLTLHMVRASLPRLVERAVSYCSSLAREKSIQVTVDSAADLPDGHFDTQRMLQVVTNLLSNAIKQSDEGSRVLLSARVDPTDPSMLSVSVQDWGRGIPPDRCARLFERLFQVSEQDAAVRGGLGLGLHLCRELVRLHGGTISVKSELGAGSTFTFTIPTYHPIPDPEVLHHEESPSCRG